MSDPGFKVDYSDPRLVGVAERVLADAGFGPPVTRVGYGDLCGLFVWCDPDADVPDVLVDDALSTARVTAARWYLAAMCAAGVRGRAVVAAHLVDDGEFEAATAELAVAAEQADVLSGMATGWVL